MLLNYKNEQKKKNNNNNNKNQIIDFTGDYIKEKKLLISYVLTNYFNFNLYVYKHRNIKYDISCIKYLRIIIKYE